MVDIKKKKLEKLKERIKRETDSNFFICEHKCMRVEFEQAMDFEFKCPECGELMEEQDNASKIDELTKDIKKLESELKA